jgi:hypothetical protein
MVVDDGRPHVSDLSSLRQAIDDEGIERVDVRHGDMDEEVISARNHEDSDRLREGDGPVPEGLDVVSGGRPDPDRDEGLDNASDGAEVNVRVVPADDAPVAQGAYPFEGRRRRDTDRLRKVAIGLPCIVLQGSDQVAVEFV